MRGYVGYLGPLPAAATAGHLDFAAGAVKAPASGGDRLRILAASKVCKQDLAIHTQSMLMQQLFALEWQQ